MSGPFGRSRETAREQQFLAVVVAGRLVCSGKTVQKSGWREVRPRMGLWRWRGLQAGPAPDPAPPGVLQSTAQRRVFVWAVEKGGAFTEEDGGKWGLWRKWGEDPRNRSLGEEVLFCSPLFSPPYPSTSFPFFLFSHSFFSVALFLSLSPPLFSFPPSSSHSPLLSPATICSVNSNTAQSQQN